MPQQNPMTARPVTKPEFQVFPELRFSETGMKSEPGYMSVNFRQYRTIYYNIRGIVENPRVEKISTTIFALFYDEKSEIVGIGQTYVSNLDNGQKTKFEISQVESEMFARPKTFELIVISNP